MLKDNCVLILNKCVSLSHAHFKLIYLDLSRGVGWDHVHFAVIL